MSAPLLDVADLRIRFAGGSEVVRGVGFTLGRERLGIVGETGSGKSLIGRALLKLLPRGAAMSAARLAFDGIDLLAAGERALRALRGRRLGLVLQDPRFSLNPAMSIGAQIEEACPRPRRRAPARGARQGAGAARGGATSREPQRVHGLYPHQVSGGMGQRAMIAMMLAPDPDLLIADEPTSALDVAVQAQVLSMLDDEVARRGMGLILISHDLALVALVLRPRAGDARAGEIVESCAAAALAAARHPYTRRLLAAQLELLAVIAARGLTVRFGGHAWSSTASSFARRGGRGVRHRRRDRARASRRCCGRSPGCIARTVGTLALDGAPQSPRRAPARAGAVQMVFQDPYGSLHPRHTVDARAGASRWRSIASTIATRAHGRGARRGRARAGASASAIRISSPAASASASPSPAPSCWRRGCCCWTSRPRRSTCSVAGRDPRAAAAAAARARA